MNGRTMKLFGKDLENSVAVIAEIGVNHEGSFDAAANMIKLASESGADAVKFQTYTPERYCTTSDPERFSRVSRFSLSENEHRDLAAIAKDCGVAFLSTPVTEDVVPFLAETGSALKIASGDITFEPVIRAVAREDLVTIMSTGAATIEEIDQAIEWYSEESKTANLSERLVLLHCVSAYPTPVDQANVLSVPFLRERYGLITGFSNHVTGNEACMAAVALGASIIEIHFTDQKAGRTFHDHALSADPDDLKSLINSINLIRASLGNFDKKRQACEAEGIEGSRKGIIAARDISAGTILQADDLMYARPATEFSSQELPLVLGKTLNKDTLKGQLILRDGIN
jgi:N,N'-diacetyllegionaminate synthase